MKISESNRSQRSISRKFVTNEIIIGTGCWAFFVAMTWDQGIHQVWFVLFLGCFACTLVYIIGIAMVRLLGAGSLVDDSAKSITRSLDPKPSDKLSYIVQLDERSLHDVTRCFVRWSARTLLSWRLIIAPAIFGCAILLMHLTGAQRSLIIAIAILFLAQ